MDSQSPSQSPSLTSSTFPVVAKTSFISFNQPISVKLDDKNFLIWKQQVLFAIYGHELEKYIEGPDSWPQKFTSTENAQRGGVNAEYKSWKKQDQLLMSWLLSSMTEAMLIRVVGCDMAYQVWERVQEFFASQTRAKIRQFKTELRNTKKGDKTMNDYLLKIKSLVDALISIGNPVGTAEHINYIFEGLCEEYDHFICSVNSRLEPYSVSEIEALLIAQEIRFEKHTKAVNTLEKVSVNVASTDQKDKVNNDSNKNSQQVFPGNYRANFQGRGGRSYGRGRGRSNRNGGRFVVCQLCNKPRHVVINCYHKFDHNFQH